MRGEMDLGSVRGKLRGLDVHKSTQVQDEKHHGLALYFTQRFELRLQCRNVSQHFQFLDFRLSLRVGRFFSNPCSYPTSYFLASDHQERRRCEVEHLPGHLCLFTILVPTLSDKGGFLPLTSHDTK
ncbi:hypothetical protein J6590_008334 [Homalodisca vitripennis]|nr:hypothetical protein J6590_008334 [Homalodisca vitripennis]